MLFSIILLVAASSEAGAIRAGASQKINETNGGFSGVLDDSDDFGISVSEVGDLDGDGNVEIAVGAISDDDGGTDRGAVWLLSLDSAGAVVATTKISDTAGGFTGILDDTDEFGTGVAVLGDVNGDTVPDLAVGAQQDDDGGGNRGAVWILFLNTDGSVASSQKISDTDGGLSDPLLDGDAFGAAVAGLGDIDGDGVPDLAVGGVDGLGQRGSVWAIRLLADGTVKGDQRITEGSGGFTGDLDSGDIFGDGLAGLGDLDEDGVPDLAVGAYRDDDGGTNRGAVWILYLNNDGTVSSHQKISSTVGGFTGSLADGDNFGVSLDALGDLDGDGTLELAVGAYAGDDGALPQQGSAWILSIGTDGTVSASVQIGDGLGGFPGTLADDNFGSAVAHVPDLNGDGVDDLVVGTRGDDENGVDRGAVYVLFLNDCGDGVKQVGECCDLGAGNGEVGSGCSPVCGCLGICTVAQISCATAADCPDGEGCCGNASVPLEAGEQCDDGNMLDGDCCNAVCQVEVGPCNDGDNCTTGDVCAPGGCAGTPLDCSFLDSACTDGQCDTLNGECVSVSINEANPCDDGNACSVDDVCLSGICSACGNGTTDPGCGETCDPPVSGYCDATCILADCGDTTLQLGEECDDGNTQNGDGCSATCQLEDRLCIEGLRPSVSRQAKKVAFASDYDYLGTNADENQEILLFDRRLFTKDLKKLVKKQGLDLSTAKAQLLTTSPSKYLLQLTNTTAPVVNDFPSTDGTGRVVAFVSSGDLTPGAPGNADGNAEIFRLDVKRATLLQVTDTSGLVTNLNPNLRAFRGALLAFDSDGDLATGGNLEGNREVFVYSYQEALRGGPAITQLTSTANGDSTVGRNANYWQRLTAFSSTADLGINPEFNSEIFLIEDAPSSLTQVTMTTSGDNEEASQAIGDLVAFTSNGDLAGANADGNREIFVWDGAVNPLAFWQIGATLGCPNSAPSIDNRGRYIAFQSGCNHIPALGNPAQSIFIWDNNRARFLPLVVRGDGGTNSAAPQASKAVSPLTFEGNPDSVANPAVCFLDVKRLLKTLEALP